MQGCRWARSCAHRPVPWNGVGTWRCPPYKLPSGKYAWGKWEYLSPQDSLAQETHRRSAAMGFRVIRPVPRSCFNQRREADVHAPDSTEGMAQMGKKSECRSARGRQVILMLRRGIYFLHEKEIFRSKSPPGMVRNRPTQSPTPASCSQPTVTKSALLELSHWKMYKRKIYSAPDRGPD
jgi:hypothetical protein